jgi:thiol-disulfide isomerase/thioredoxin
VRRVLTLVAVVLVLATGCKPEDLPTPDNKVDVDTPALVEAKAAAGVADCVPGSGSQVDDGLPDITLPCLGGGPDVDLATLRGPMVVSLWAQWCGPCRDEMPILQRFHDTYGDQVAVLGIDYLDTQPDSALALMDKAGATYPSLADPAGDLSAQKPFPVLRGLPYLAFVAADGTVAYLKAGPVDSRQELVDLVEQHLGIRL